MTRLEKLQELTKKVQSIRNSPVIISGIQELNAIRVQSSKIAALYRAVSDEYKEKAVEKTIQKYEGLVALVSQQKSE